MAGQFGVLVDAERLGDALLFQVAQGRAGAAADLQHRHVGRTRRRMPELAVELTHVLALQDRRGVALEIIVGGVEVDLVVHRSLPGPGRDARRAGDQYVVEGAPHAVFANGVDTREDVVLGGPLVTAPEAMVALHAFEDEARVGRRRGLGIGNEAARSGRRRPPPRSASPKAMLRCAGPVSLLSTAAACFITSIRTGNDVRPTRSMTPASRARACNGSGFSAALPARTTR